MRKLFTILFVFILASCAKESPPDLPVIPEIDLPDGFYTLDEAVSMVYSTLEYLEGPGTRSERQREITRVEVVTGATVPTRSGYCGNADSDPLLYVFNFGDNDGYAVVSPTIHEENSPLAGNNVLCITESGSMVGISAVMATLDEEWDPYMNPFDDCENEYLDDDPYDGDALENGEDFIIALVFASIISPTQLKPPDQPYDPNNPGGGGGGGSGGGTSGSGWTNWMEIGSKGPLLKTKWKQTGAPYNGGSIYPAGCVPIAVAQICTYYKFPKSFNTYASQPLDWEIISKLGVYNSGSYYSGDIYEQALTRHFISRIGFLCDANFNKNGTSSTASKAKKAFKEMGYKNVNKYLGYKSGKILNMLKDSRPVFLTAIRKKNIIKWEGHGWVLDGYKEFKRTKIGRVTTSQTQSWVHCNFGWQGMHDGWYNNESTFKLSAHILDYDSNIGDRPDNTGEWDGYGDNYKFFFRILTMDKPK